MLRAILILVVSVSVSACSSQGRTQVAQQVAEVVLGIAFDGFVHDDSLDYDEAEILYGDDHQPRQIKKQTFVPLSADYQHFLRRQGEIVEHASQRGPMVLRDPEDLTKSPSPDPGEL